MDSEVLDRLKNAGLLSDQPQNLGFVSTGNYALNKVISGDYTKGIPIGMITQFHGESSTAKTVFATHILKEAQAAGHYTMLVDSENAYNPEFAEHLGIDPKKLIYAAPETLEQSFEIIQKTVMEIRQSDRDTPIVIAYDSIAVSPSKAEFEAENFDGNNMVGAIRAKSTGACLRKINPILRMKKVALVIVNQIRNKVGVMYGSPDTMAAGGKSLEYYLGVNLKCISNKTSDLLKDDLKNIIGIQGKVRNTKNKVSIPHKECEFELLYNDGLDPYAGLLKLLEMEGLVKRSGAWYSVAESDKKFQSKDFKELLLNKSEGFEPICKLLGV
tara:strand:- start:616 stop:1599 length:984 start_codon:yes stop_codon:yes gene_type:complete